MKDLNFISGQFFETEIPKDKMYLLKYFKKDVQRSFLKYYLVFGSTSTFCDHTGHATSKSSLIRFEKKFHELINAYNNAKQNMNFETVWEIESGKYKTKVIEDSKDA